MKSRFLKAKSPPGLMLTSLLDMFTIILIFLIVNFQAEDHEFELNEQIELPSSTSRSPFKESIGLTITQQQILVQDTPVVDFGEDGLDRQFYDEGRIPALVSRLEGDYQTYLKQRARDPEAEAIILVQADKNLDYDTLYLVLRSASLAGFSKYRMATMKQ